MAATTVLASTDDLRSASFDREVLQLAQGQSEHDLETLLKTQAEELGLVYRAPLSKEHGHTSHSEASSRHSTSVDSRTSVSTGLTSEWSRDRISLYSDDTHDYPRSMRSLNDNMSRRQSTSSSAFSISTTSTTSSRKSAFQRFKSLGMRLHRSRSGIECCAHCPRDTASRRRALHELPCGHRWCTQALRNIVVEAISTQAHPMCCQINIADRFIRHVLTADELAIHEQQQKPVQSGSPSRRDSTQLLDCPPVAAQHTAEHVRFEAWISKTRAALLSQRTDMLRVLQDQHQKALDNQLEDHANDMTIAEDRQVKAEADLRALQAQEVRDNATALKHMEAYCAGHLSNGERHHRTITEQDLKELQKTQAIRDAMQHKHNNAINILRGEQTRRLRVRAQRHDRELHMLQSKQRREVMALEHRHRAEETALDTDFNTKLQRLQYRWHLQDMIQLKKLDESTT